MSLLKSLFGGGSKHESSKEENLLEIKGTVLYESGKIIESIAVFSTGIAKFPKNPYFYYLRGNAKEDLKQWNEAIDDFQKYLLIVPDQYSALFRIGLCHQQMKQFPMALKYYNLSEKHYEVTMTLADEMQLRTTNDIKGSYYTVPKEKLIGNRAIVKASLGDSDGAILDCTKAITFNPKYANPYFIRGIEYLRRNDGKKAKEDLTAASNLGHEMATQQLKKNFSENSELDLFYEQVAEFAESPQATEATGGRKYRNGFENDLRSNLSVYGHYNNISNDILIQEGIEYSLSMWAEWHRHNAQLPDSVKAHICYEISMAFKSIRPNLDQNRFWRIIFENAHGKYER